ncbi:peptidase M4 thermolysin [Schizopora paradoxa]|uniref:Peptidase M4 thermolysin n=1 Tax=Schizopora paradoxa TaxID=27342 RepID=A0A0H2RRE4_9AGAM|nr:peptidase M4 thermolysin [Schizopora paradoxa]
MLTPLACCIVPPYVLARIAEHPDAPEQARISARSTLGLANTLASVRAAIVPYEGRWGGRRLDRMIYDCKNTRIVDMEHARFENELAVDDASVNRCYDFFEAIFSFFHVVFGRNSIDDRGMSMLGSVHYGENFSNAMWDGTQVVFGDGDGVYWNNFSSLDVVAHEIMHGITQHSVHLKHQGESGALDESMADVFASMFKQYELNQTAADADWLIGTEIFTSRVRGDALRSLKAPGSAFDDEILGKDIQVASYDKVLTKSCTDDFGSAHIHFGVPNHAFYLFAIALGGHSWERAGTIWYAALTDKDLKSDAGFIDFATLTIKHAQGYGDSVAAAVIEAWKGVGINLD